MTNLHGYYFLAMKREKDFSPHPSIALVKIKTGDDPQKTPYVAFVNRDLGEKYIKYMNMSKTAYLIAESDIDPTDAGYRSTNGVLLFESFEQVLIAYKNQNKFDFSTLVKKPS